MLIHHRVLYLSTKTGLAKDQHWWNAWKFTVAVKSAKMNGYCRVPKLDGVLRRIDSTNIAVARQMFGEWMYATAIREFGANGFAIVPVPSKDAVVGSPGPFRHMQMLDEALALLPTKPPVHDVVRFTKILKKASEGGPRSLDELYPHLTLHGILPSKPIVLVDDVVTGGGHMLAVRRKLIAAGCAVQRGIACGRTVWTVDGDPWEESQFDPSGGVRFNIEDRFKPIR